MNEPHDPNVTTDSSVPPAAIPDGADAPAGNLPTVPGYHVLGEIARGGMGKVLAAFDLGLDRDVALKILLPGANADRFVRESKITARLPHPGIPPVHALGTLADGSPFLAMKLIAGQTLAVEMKTADRPRLLQAFTQVCQAVGFAHNRGVIHRDLKPANIMVGAFGEVQVMDWGLAKYLTSRETADQPRSPATMTEPGAGTDANETTDRSLGDSADARTQAGTVLGTPAYMAPEQARGKVVDARADVFALGGILCAILTGQPPFRGKSALEVIQRAAAADLADAHARLDRCGADADLVALCRRCLSSNPLDRPANGQAVADGLLAYLTGVQERLQAVERERAVAVAREAEQRKRRRVQLSLTVAVLLVLVAGVAVSGYFAFEANTQKTIAQGKADLATNEANRAEEEAKEAVKQTGIAKANEDRARWNERLAKDSNHAKAGPGVAGWGAERLGADESVAGGNAHGLRANPGEPARHCHLGQTCLSLEEPGGAHQQGDLRGVQPGRQAYRHGELRPDGEGVGRGHGDREARPQGAHEAVTSVAFSPDGKRIVTGSGDPSIGTCQAR